jgi:Arc/MetJ-type ribon-helix-helix transcriptional regulator
MKMSIRTTIALDEKTAEILESLRSPGSSQSDVVRKALRLYNEFKDFDGKDINNLKVDAEMLSGGEHVILDLDHLALFLKIIDELPMRDVFWEDHKMIARNHAEEFRNLDVEHILRRLEACNLFRIGRSGDGLTLIFGNEAVKKFVRVFLEEIFMNLHKDVELKDDITKIRVKLPRKEK